jgi:hypothetical protein
VPDHADQSAFGVQLSSHHSPLTSYFLLLLSLRIDPLPLDPAWHEKNAGTIFDLFLFQPVSAPIEGGLEAYATPLQRLEPFAYDDAIM